MQDQSSGTGTDKGVGKWNTTPQMLSGRVTDYQDYVFIGKKADGRLDVLSNGDEQFATKLLGHEGIRDALPNHQFGKQDA